MTSFSTVTYHVPQCIWCKTTVLDDHGQEVRLQAQNLPVELRQRLEGEGWRITLGKPKSRSLRAGFYPDGLKCPTCCATSDKAVADLQASLRRPAVKTVDMAAKLGAGWTLRQREGDADDQKWLLFQEDEPRGIVQRYRRVNGSFSKGWEALSHFGGTHMVRISAIGRAKWTEKSNFLWRSRDLAAWGLATSPDYYAPLPTWATRKKAS